MCPNFIGTTSNEILDPTNRLREGMFTSDSRPTLTSPKKKTPWKENFNLILVNMCSTAKTVPYRITSCERNVSGKCLHFVEATPSFCGARARIWNQLFHHRHNVHKGLVSISLMQPVLAFLLKHIFLKNGTTTLSFIHVPMSRNRPCQSVVVQG